MEYLNASAWRIEAEQVQSEMTTRLLTWMSRTRGGESLNPEEVAERLRDSLKELTDAQSAAVLVRRMPTEYFALLSSTGIEGDPLVAQETLKHLNRATYDASALVSVIPRWPFFPSEAAPTAQVLLGELGDYVRDACNTAGGEHGFAAAGMMYSGGVVGPVKSEMHSGGEVEVPTLVVPLLAGDSDGVDGEVVGIALLWIATPDGGIPGWLRAPLEGAALQGGGWLADALRADRIAHSYRKLGEVFANAIDARDVHRTGHSSIVAYYCTLIARHLKLSEQEIEMFEFAGMLHGIGKLAVPDSLLFKSEPMSEDDRELIRAATVTAGDWLRSVDGLGPIAQMIRSQNEHYDGSGYPDGLKGQEVPLGSRVLAVAMRFAALTRPRADRRAMSVVSGAFESLATGAGKELDPEIVDAFLAAMGRKL